MSLVLVKCSIGLLALKVAKGWQRGQTWPLLISLAEYSDAGLSGLLQERSGIVWDDLYPQIVKGKVALYLDALNECPNSLYESCQNEILSLLTECPEASIYVSTRSSELTIELELPIFEINPMDIELQRLFLSAYLSDDQQSDEILNQLFLKPGSSVIAGRPILLRFVAYERLRIPAGKKTLSVFQWFLSEKKNELNEFGASWESLIELL